MADTDEFEELMKVLQMVLKKTERLEDQFGEAMALMQSSTNAPEGTRVSLTADLCLSTSIFSQICSSSLFRQFLCLNYLSSTCDLCVT
jgi:hypothetical protein